MGSKLSRISLDHTAVRHQRVGLPGGLLLCVLSHSQLVDSSAESGLKGVVDLPLMQAASNIFYLQITVTNV